MKANRSYLNKFHFCFWLENLHYFPYILLPFLSLLTSLIRKQLSMAVRMVWIKLDQNLYHTYFLKINKK